MFLRAEGNQAALVADHGGRGPAEETHVQLGVGLDLLLLHNSTLASIGILITSRLDITIDIRVGVAVIDHVCCSWTED